MKSTFKGWTSSGAPGFLSHVVDDSPSDDDALIAAASPGPEPGGGDVSRWRRLVGDPPASSWSALPDVYEHVRFLLVHVLHGFRPLHYRRDPSVRPSLAHTDSPGRCA